MSRLLLLAIDAANADLVEQWTADGSMPNIARLMRSACVGRSRSLDGFFVGSTWPSLYTGCSPARHGHHSLVQLRRGSYQYYQCADEGLLDGEPFWEHLGRAGRRVAILDVPLSRLSPGINGVQTVEWGAHDALYGFRAWPGNLEQEIRQRCGEHPLGPSCDGAHRDYPAFVDKLLRGIKLKSELTRDVLRREPWAFAMQVFTEAHCAGHQCWHLHDAQHPAHDREAVAALGDPLKQVYIALDEAIGEIAREHEDVPLLLVAAHGMSYWYGAQFLLKDILAALGVYSPVRREPAPRGRLEPVAQRVWKSLPEGVRARVRPLIHRAEPSRPLRLDVNPAASRCFPVNNGLAVGGVRLNLRGREPAGVLAPGAEADEFCAELTRDLLDITDSRTGAPLILRVRRTAGMYTGPHSDDLPDLLVEWSDATPTGSTTVGAGSAATVQATSPKFGVITGANSYGRTGEHRPEGFFVAQLPGVHAGRLQREVSVMDFAPTICALLGVPLPDVDGKPIAELLRG